MARQYEMHAHGFQRWVGVGSTTVWNLSENCWKNIPLTLKLLFVNNFLIEKPCSIKVPIICNINFWIENAHTPLWHFSENSSILIGSWTLPLHLLQLLHSECMLYATQACVRRSNMLSPAFHQASWLFSNSRKPTSMLYEGKHIHLLVGGLLAYGYTVNKYHFLLYSPPFFGKFFIRPKIVSFEKSLFLFLVSLSNQILIVLKSFPMLLFLYQRSSHLHHCPPLSFSYFYILYQILPFP